MKIEVPYIPLKTVEDPSSAYPGFHPHSEIYPAGYLAQPGRLPFACDTQVDQDVAVTLRDGTVIYADVYRPVGSDEAPVPAILAWGPAGKRGKNLASGLPPAPPPPGMTAPPPNKAKFPPNSETSGLQAWGGLDPAIWVQYGYAIVNADPRGVYKSQGRVQYFGRQDTEDGYDCVEWIAGQPWCDGKVAMSGDHWYAMVQWFIAAAQPPHLAAIAPAEGHANLYVDEFVRDGIPRPDWTAKIRSYSDNGIEDICWMCEHYTLMNEYWEDKIADFSRISVPAYVTASYTQTNHSRGTFQGFNEIASRDKWLRIHNIGEFIDYRLPENILDLKRFFDHFLKGADNGWENTPRVRLAILDPGGEDITGRPEESFPLARQQVETLYLTSGGALSPQAQEAEGEVSYDIAGQECARFTFTFQKETEITGFLKLKLWVEADGSDDMDLFVRLFKLSEDGERLFSDKGNAYSGPNGRLRVSHRALDEARSTPLEPKHTHRREELLSPGQIVPVEIGIWPTSLLFHPGQQLQVEISGYEVRVAHASGDLISTRNRGRHIIHTGGQYDSQLLFPVIPGKE